MVKVVRGISLFHLDNIIIVQDMIASSMGTNDLDELDDRPELE